MSQAGKREGLAGERSGLFLEMIRVITEMREATNGEYPKFAIWENVRGAFSSSKGEDFRCVLERFARIVEPDVSIPRPSGKNGKWAKSGAISGNGWSLAWRLFDAKYWGVAQRRQRIALVMDFGGQRASEILFERTSMSGDSCESIPAWKTFARTPETSVAGYDRMVESRNSVTGGAESEGTRRSGREGIGRVLESDHRETSTQCTEPAAYTLKIRSGCEGGGKGALVQTELSATISTLQDQTLICLAENPSLHNLKQKISPVVFESHSQDARYTQQSDTSPTCTAQWGTGGNNMPLVIEKKAFAMQRIGEYKESEQASTMKSRDYKDATDLITEKETKNLRWIVRRLTPLEDERLQGFPEIMEANITEMTKDEYIAFNLATGQIIADCENGKVYTTKGPGGNILKEPKELSGTIIKGYRVVSIRNGDVKKQCRVHRVIWIAKNGIIPDGLVVDHINNDKLDNRISNLQLLTAKDNSTKASKDGLYLSGNENPVTVLPEEKRIEVALMYQTGEFTMRQLAERYGISKSRVQQIVKTYGWTDIGEWIDENGKKHKPADSPRYKALGNSIALPQWYWIFQKMKSYIGENPTLGSLFDGIGGFPLVFQNTYGEGTAIWGSEIDSFCVAVTKKHFPEKQRG